MDMFADWESPALPDVTPPSTLTGLKEKTMKDLRSILDITFEFGFETARKDQCHLLFAGWNGLGKFHVLGVINQGDWGVVATHGQVPDSWHRVFQELEDLGTVKKEQAKFVGRK